MKPLDFAARLAYNFRVANKIAESCCASAFVAWAESSPPKCPKRKHYTDTYRVTPLRCAAQVKRKLGSSMSILRIVMTP
jgi:hypothetical protein